MSWLPIQTDSDEITSTEWNEFAQCVLNVSSNAIHFSSNAKTIYANSGNVRYRFPASSTAKANYAGSSQINRALLNSISSNLDTRVDSIFNFSSNKSLYADSSNVRLRFQASSLARQSYLHSSNQSIHTFNVIN